MQIFASLTTWTNRGTVSSTIYLNTVNLSVVIFLGSYLYISNFLPVAMVKRFCSIFIYISTFRINAHMSYWIFEAKRPKILGLHIFIRIYAQNINGIKLKLITNKQVLGWQLGDKFKFVYFRPVCFWYIDLPF